MSNYVLVHREMNDEYLEHHGVVGMHWGIRRYQNADGTLTETGKKDMAEKILKTTTINQINMRKNVIEQVLCLIPV